MASSTESKSIDCFVNMDAPCKDLAPADPKKNEIEMSLVNLIYSATPLDLDVAPTLEQEEALIIWMDNLKAVHNVRMWDGATGRPMNDLRFITDRTIWPDVIKNPLNPDGAINYDSKREEMRQSIKLHPDTQLMYPEAPYLIDNERGVYSIEQIRVVINQDEIPEFE